MEIADNYKFILPKPHLSWSQLTCWQSNKGRYRKEYFENGKKLDNKYLQFGKNIATMIENGQHKILLPELETYDSPEFEIRCKVLGVPILSKLDTYNKVATPIVPSNVFREFKTGKVPWDKARVQSHDQLLFYAVALKWSTGEFPPYCDLDWIETKEASQEVVDFWREGDKIVHVTGRILSFHREFDAREIERMEQLIVKVAFEISEAYQEFLKEI
jgi:hypothetical protein